MTWLLMGSHSVTCHPTRVNPALTSQLVLDIPTPKGWKAKLSYRQFTGRESNRDLSITSPTPNHYTTEQPWNDVDVEEHKYQ